MPSRVSGGKPGKSRKKPKDTPMSDPVAVKTEPAIEAEESALSTIEKPGATTTDKPKISMPTLDWKTATCIVCGKPFDYHGKKKPKICRDGGCRYKFEYNIDPDKWAGHQSGLFDK